MRTILFDFGNVIAFFDHRRATRRFAPETDLTEVEVFDAIYNTALEEEFEGGNICGEEFIHSACAVIGYKDTHARFRRDFGRSLPKRGRASEHLGDGGYRGAEDHDHDGREDEQHIARVDATEDHERDRGGEHREEPEKRPHPVPGTRSRRDL